MRGAKDLDRRGIASDLRAAIEGEVRFDTGSRALYATDASNYRMPPIGVVVPHHLDELVEIHRVCREHGAPIVLRGGGTSLAGQGCNTAVLIDFSKYLHQILEIDPDRRLARVQPGCILDDLRETASEGYGLTFGPDPSTHAYCTLGGMLGNNSCGRHSVQSEFHGSGPRMADNLVELEVLTYRGERLRIARGGQGVPEGIAERLRQLAEAHADEIRSRYPQIPRRVSGYNLDELLPEKGFQVPRALVGTESTSGMKLYDDPAGEQHIWEVREAGLGATAFIPGKADTYEGWEDSAVPPDRLGEYLRRLSKLAEKYEYESALYGHYGQGCIHARWNFDLVTRDGIRVFRRFLDEASDLVLELGGSISGEHGDGQSRAELLPKQYGEELVEAFREFKSIWDPRWRMNPGKVVDPYKITDNLRLGTDYAPIAVEPHFAYPDDHGEFAHATVRCVGIGKCRPTEGGAMCPS